MHRGVYAVGHELSTWYGRCMGAVLACPPSVVSHFSRLGSGDSLRSDRGRSISPLRAARTRSGALSVHFAWLDCATGRNVDGFTGHGPCRTFLDLAGILCDPRFERALERAEELRLFDLAGGRRASCASAAVTRVRGVPAGACALPDEPAFAARGLEERFLELVRRRRPAAPGDELQRRRLSSSTPTGSAERFAVELDVYETHGSGPPSRLTRCDTRS